MYYFPNRIFFSKIAFTGIVTLLFTSTVERLMPIGQFSGAVCKMYVRRRSKLKRLCTQARKLTPIIISDVRRSIHMYMYVCSRYSVYFQIEAIGGDVVCPSDRLPLHVLIRESFC